ADFPTGSPENSFIELFTQKIISNPCKDFIHVQINSGTEGGAEFFLYDINGKQISRLQQPIHSGINEIKLDAQNFSAGFYFVKTMLGKIEKVSKVMIAE